MRVAPGQEEAAHAERASDGRVRWKRRLLAGVAVLVAVLLLAVLPPLINIGRYQRRVTAAMTGALGRPVHVDRIAFHLLPLPGLTITNFVVSESEKFGAEPVLRANTVEARLRVGSLWQRRVEISRITLQAPSVNLVHSAGGEWNLGGILMRASQISSAPTVQRGAGDAPRFPYIEAMDARVNVKAGEDKLPFSLTGAAFALWLPSPEEWHVRIAGKPVRTDTDVSDVGELQVEGVLGRAAALASAPVNLHVTFKPTPLGELSKLVAEKDAGWRGEASASLDVLGTLGDAKVATDVHLRNVRRADFVPGRSMQVDAHCEAIAEGVLRALREVRCAVPTEQKESVLDAFLSTKSAPRNAAGVLTLAAEVPSMTDWSSAKLHVEKRGSPQFALDWLRLFSRRIPAGMTVTGESAIDVSHGMQHGRGAWELTMSCRCVVSGVPEEIESGAVRQRNEWLLEGSYNELNSTANLTGVSLSANSTRDGNPALIVQRTAIEDSVGGVIQRNGYTLTYPSTGVAALASRIFPPLGDGLPIEVSGPVQARRSWGAGQPQVWTAVPVRTAKLRKRR